MGRFLLPIFVALVAALAIACDGDDDGGEPTPTSEPRVSSTPVPEDPSPTVALPSTDDITPVVEKAPGEPWTEADAQALLAAALLTPEDVSSIGTYVVQADTTATNADAATADPEAAASIGRCGRLLARTQTMLAEDPVGAFLAAETLSFFSSATVYATPAGAEDCSNEFAARAAADLTLIPRQFGSLFVDPAAVVLIPVDYPEVGDSTFAATLTGQTDANGTIIDLTILVVSVRVGNVTAVVGSARSAQDPPVEELQPFVDIVLARIEANQ